MKVLLLLRHADSAEKMQGQTDQERSLTSKGVKQAAAVAAYIKKKSILPEKVIASTAIRVRHTVDPIVSKLQIKEVAFVDELYEADLDTYLRLVHEAGDCQTLLVVGHNPSITAFATHISKTRLGDIGTANLLLFHHKGSTWNQVSKSQCELMEHFVP
jgi:phosphohistidine phosphatase